MTLEGIKSTAYAFKDVVLEKGSQLVQKGKELGPALVDLVKKIGSIALNFLNTVGNYCGKWGGATIRVADANRLAVATGLGGLVLGVALTYRFAKNVQSQSKDPNPPQNPPRTGSQEGPQLVQDV